MHQQILQRWHQLNPHCSWTQGGQKWAEHQQGAGRLGALEIPEEVRAPASNPLAAVQRRLALTAPPKKMLGREAEHQRITTFVQEALAPGVLRLKQPKKSGRHQKISI